MNDDELDHLIRWTYSPPEFSPSFQREVWARVSVAQGGSRAAGGRRWMEAFFPVLGRPATALAAVLVMLLLGVGLGKLTVPQPDPVELRSAYLTSIHPLMAAHHDDRK